MRNNRWKQWEIALALALTITLSCAAPAAPAWWWGAIFPQYALPERVCTETERPPQAGERAVALRFRLPELLRELFSRVTWPGDRAAVRGE